MCGDFFAYNLEKSIKASKEKNIKKPSISIRKGSIFSVEGIKKLKLKKLNNRKAF